MDIIPSRHCSCVSSTLINAVILVITLIVIHNVKYADTHMQNIHFPLPYQSLEGAVTFSIVKI